MIRKSFSVSKTLVLMIIVAIMFGLLCLVFLTLYRRTSISCFEPLYITFLTFCWHFSMRLIAGETVTLLYRNREFHYNAKWYQLSKVELKLYKAIKIKHWKTKLITAKPEQFDLTIRTYDELLHNMTQAEVVHEIIMVLSFVPLLFIIPFGAPGVFITTSIIACLIDMLFVMIQRYNRPRVLRAKKLFDRRKV